MTRAQFWRWFIPRFVIHLLATVFVVVFVLHVAGVL